ncbi:MAG: threonine--tRNA ligase [Candidatus Micrarchaeota archaeon]
MRILQLHCDYARYKPRQKALKSAAELTEEQKKGGEFKNVVVVFASFEKGDDALVLKKAAADVEKNFKEVKADTILVYPYAHLSNNLTGPGEAVKLLDAFTKAVKGFCKTAEQSPFGYYKEFELKCKGHPLSELSKSISGAGLEAEVAALGGTETKVKEIVAKEVVSESLKLEEKVKREFFLLTPDGKLLKPEEAEKGSDLQKFADYEIDKKRAYSSEPAHVRLMKEHEIADYEPASDVGNMRWYPKGRLVKRLLEEAVYRDCVGYGAMEVETPIMYDLEHPALKKYLNRFPARQYLVQSDDKQFFLRFSACFGQFLMSRDMVISHKHLPLKMLEVTKYSFRREQSGEVAGLRRLRAFTMPDMHTLCADLKMAEEEFRKQFDLSAEYLDRLNLEYETAFRSEKKFFDENKDWFVSMVKARGKPALLELFSERYAYFICKFEFNVVDSQDKGTALSTVQIDVENCDNFGFNYIGEDGKKHGPLVLHTSVSGATDRVVYALLEQQARKIAGKKTPEWPLWLAPIQVRLVPITDKQLPHCEKTLKDLENAGVRADLDDRQETLQKKVRAAELEWIPFVAVVGDKEIAESALSVRVRSTGKNEKMTVKEVAALIEKEHQGKPNALLSLPSHLSKRPLFAK